MQDLPIIGSAFHPAQIIPCNLAVKDHAVGIGPASGHGSSSIPPARQAGRLEKLWLLRGGFDSLLLRLSGGDDGGTAGFL